MLGMPAGNARQFSPASDGWNERRPTHTGAGLVVTLIPPDQSLRHRSSWVKGRPVWRSSLGLKMENVCCASAAGYAAMTEQREISAISQLNSLHQFGNADPSDVPAFLWAEYRARRDGDSGGDVSVTRPSFGQAM